MNKYKINYRKRVIKLNNNIFNGTDDLRNVRAVFENGGVRGIIDFDVYSDKGAVIFNSVSIAEGSSHEDNPDIAEFSNDTVFIGDSIDFARFDTSSGTGVRLYLPRTVDYGVNSVLVLGQSLPSFLSFISERTGV